ncbi:MAG: hypothetical protein HETSPECPRED_010540 [Heterodermia speciosa]|uniref:Small secreted protein n=1 Tax=Heterodermia speciosa TaxID=116794 RepID=A0A8H3IQX7_9LECA|nr:MAG: hypothetical protein HETSPECPRED_010540 [Heterodermia speciosa]
MSLTVLFVLLQALVISTNLAASPKTLNITAISANAEKQSTLECWQLAAPFLSSTTAGTSGAVFAQLGEGGATSYGILPPQFDGGLHNAPAVQWVSFTAGKAVISLPNSTQTATVYGGREGLILAADTKNVSTLGHRTTYPSNHTTVAIQIPLENNAIPLHSILHPGACVKYEENS